MREAIGGTWLFNIVIFFVILFTGYLCLSINHTKAFNVKDDIVKIVERENGIDSISNVNSDHDKALIASIVRSLQEFGYRTKSSCPSADGGPAWYGFDREGHRDFGNNNSAFCIREVVSADGTDGRPKTVYYQVVVFYQLDLPLLNNLMKFTIKGDTRLIYS